MFVLGVRPSVHVCVCRLHTTAVHSTRVFRFVFALGVRPSDRVYARPSRAFLGTLPGRSQDPDSLTELSSIEIPNAPKPRKSCTPCREARSKCDFESPSAAVCLRCEKQEFRHCDGTNRKVRPRTAGRVGHGWHRLDMRASPGSFMLALFATSLDSTWTIRLNFVLSVLTRQLFLFLCISVSCTG